MSVEEELRRIKSKKNSKPTSTENRNKYVNGLISRILISLILFFSILIGMNLSSDVDNFISNDVLTNNISFTKWSNLYNKYFGSIIPIKEEGIESTTVFSENIAYNTLKDYKNGYVLNLENNLIPIINSGIVVFIGDKEDYGNTVIIQGIDGVDYWYGNINNVSLGLYDYVTKGTLLGNAIDDTLYLVFQKDGEYLGYDEVVE